MFPTCNDMSSIAHCVTGLGEVGLGEAAVQRSIHIHVSILSKQFKKALIGAT